MKFENLDDCDDINVFFTIMSKADCFKKSEANIASKTQRIRNIWAHTSIKSLTDTYTKSLLAKLEMIIKMLPNEFTEKSKHD